MEKYQLVMQFAAAGMTDFDELSGFEDRLSRHLGSLATVDGHDFGMGEYNIFILTDDPMTTFERAQQLRIAELPNYGAKVAYTELLGEEYVVLWPPGEQNFTIS